MNYQYYHQPPYYAQQQQQQQQQQQIPPNAYASYNQQMPALWSNNTPYMRSNGLPQTMQTQAPVIPTAGLNNFSRPERSATLPAGYPGRSALKRPRKMSKPTEKAAEGFHYVPGPRKRTVSNPQGDNIPTPPGHTEPIQLFMSLHGTNELHLGQLSITAIDGVRKSVVAIWPHGFDIDDMDGEVWRVRFRGTPWSFTGPDAHKALAMLQKLFQEFSEYGWVFQTSVNIGTTSPRLIFIRAKRRVISFYLLYFSHSTCRVSLINFPPRVRTHLVALLQQQKVAAQSNYMEENDTMDIQVVEMKKVPGYKTSESESAHFLAGLLSSLDTLGFSLETAIPIARKGPFSWLGVGPKQELFLFRSNQAVEK
ncbi:hypothetical protein D9758_000297 [Tetrapyrgos nigripes]|uniref:Uncharacterized protein n=1 Tax=Tetrapyrgos nigripes TaxID=182062 RepID=A0A8H5H158_9AGAR|nr:hypothetical protein D9758_000297 [Tetrapyrgos nigripes]